MSRARSVGDGSLAGIELDTVCRRLGMPCMLTGSGSHDSRAPKESEEASPAPPLSGQRLQREPVSFGLDVGRREIHGPKSVPLSPSREKQEPTG